MNDTNTGAHASVTVIVHTRNEEKNIGPCLDSVKGWADEIVVMDMASEDRTVEMAQEYTDKVIAHPLILNFDAARNDSAKHSTCEWIFYLDADERMTPQLAHRISEYLPQAGLDIAGVQLPYRNHFLGRWIQFAGQWYPGYKAPMLLRNGAFTWNVRCHEGVNVYGKVVLFPADDPVFAVTHLTDPTLSHYIDKLNRYSESEAEKLGELDAECTWQTMAAALGNDFRFYYDDTNGKRDGEEGFLLSLSSGFCRLSNYMKYAERMIKSGRRDGRLMPPSASAFLRLAADAAETEEAKREQGGASSRTDMPPNWWPRVWQRIQRSGKGAALLSGTRGVGDDALRDDGWQLTGDTEGAGAGSVDSAVGFGNDWRRIVEALRSDGAFLVGTQPFPSNADEWRKDVEKAFKCTAHLLDPAPECGWLLAFGWKNRIMERTRRRVMMVPHVRAMEMFGGGETQLFETLAALRDQCVCGDVSLALRLPESLYDAIHIFSLYHGDKRDALAKLTKPIVVSTIFWDYSELRYTGAVTRAIFGQTDPGAVARALDAWRSGQLTLTNMTPDQAAESLETRSIQRDTLKHGRLLLPNAEGEARMVERVFGKQDAAIRIATNAVRPEIFLNASPEPFVERYGMRDFVMCAARLEPNKNQAMLIWALRETDIPLVLAGRFSDPEYAAMCRHWAGDNIRFIDELSQDMLASAYAAARVHALPSWSETPGLSNLEAGLVGCSLVVGNRGTESEYLGEFAFASDPGDWLSIRSAVQKAWDARSPERVERQREYILARYTWDKTAATTASAYEEALSKPVRWFIAPDWSKPDTWTKAVGAYIGGAEMPEGSLLSLYAGTFNQANAEDVFGKVTALLRELGVDEENCPDIDIVDSLPTDTRSGILLAGGTMDAMLRQRYGSRCLQASEWSPGKPPLDGK